MYVIVFDGLMYIHRHTGGLEIFAFGILVGTTIHRHTGGLETAKLQGFYTPTIHRHTGGLETRIANLGKA